MNIHTLDKMTRDASAEKEKHMTKHQHHKKQATAVVVKKPGRLKRVASWVRALFARAMEKGRKALAWAKAKVKKVYGACSVKAKAALNYLAAKLKTVKATAKRYALALNAKIGSPYEVVVRGMNAYIVPVISAARRHVRLTAMFIVPLAVFAGMVLAPVATGIGIGFAGLTTLVYKHYGVRVDATAMAVKKVIRVAGKVTGYVIEAGTLTFMVAAMVLAPVGEALVLGGLHAVSVALQYEAPQLAQPQDQEAAQEEDDAPFDSGFPNLRMRPAPTRA